MERPGYQVVPITPEQAAQMKHGKEMFWSTESYSPKDIIERYHDGLPVYVKVKSGFMGPNTLDAIQPETIFRIHEIETQPRILIEDKKDRLLSFPTDWPIAVKVEKTGEKMPISQVLEKYKLPVKIVFDKKEKWKFRIGRDKVHTNKNFGSMWIKSYYTERYLKGNVIQNGLLTTSITLIPAYLSLRKVEFYLAEGLRSGSDEEWREARDTFDVAARTIDYASRPGTKDIIIYNTEFYNFNADLSRFFQSVQNGVEKRSDSSRSTQEIESNTNAKVYNVMQPMSTQIASSGYTSSTNQMSSSVVQNQSVSVVKKTHTTTVSQNAMRRTSDSVDADFEDRRSLSSSNNQQNASASSTLDRNQTRSLERNQNASSKRDNSPGRSSASSSDFAGQATSKTKTTSTQMETKEEEDDNNNIVTLKIQTDVKPKTNVNQESVYVVSKGIQATGRMDGMDGRMAGSVQDLRVGPPSFVYVPVREPEYDVYRSWRGRPDTYRRKPLPMLMDARPNRRYEEDYYDGPDEYPTLRSRGGNRYGMMLQRDGYSTLSHRPVQPVRYSASMSDHNMSKRELLNRVYTDFDDLDGGIYYTRRPVYRNIIEADDLPPPDLVEPPPYPSTTKIFVDGNYEDVVPQRRESSYVTSAQYRDVYDRDGLHIRLDGNQGRAIESTREDLPDRHYDDGYYRW